MNISKAKRKWFEKRLLSYEIFFYGAKEYNDNFTLIEWAHGMLSRIHRHNWESIKTIREYFENMPPCDRFFEARRIEFKHKKENKESYIEVFYCTKKAKEKELKKLL